MSQFPATHPQHVSQQLHTVGMVMFVYPGVLRPGFSLCFASNHPPASIFVQTSGKPAAEFCAKSIAPLHQMSWRELILFSSPSLLIFCSLSFIEQLNMCFYWKMLRVLLGSEQAINK